MKIEVLKTGHTYKVGHFVNPEESSTIQFVDKEPNPENPTQLDLVSDGVTNEDLITVLIWRLNYLQSKFGCREKAMAITKLDEALLWLEKRTRDRVARGVEGQQKP